MNGPPWLTRLKEGGPKRLILVSALLFCLYLLARGGYAMVQRFLFILGDETALHVHLVYLADRVYIFALKPDACQASPVD